MTDMQQIETSVCGYQLFPSSTQVLTTIGKFLKIDDFRVHLFLVRTSPHHGIVRQYSQLAFDGFERLCKNDGNKKKAQHANIGGARGLPDFQGTGRSCCRQRCTTKHRWWRRTAACLWCADLLRHRTRSTMHLRWLEYRLAVGV